METIEKCPYCGKDYVGIEIFDEQDKYNCVIESRVLVERCHFCHNPIMFTYDVCKLISYYPISNVVDEVSKEIAELSPKFADMYRQCCIANNHHLFDLVGTGLRNALEQLIVDYTAKIQGIDVSDKRLKGKIDSLDPNIYADSAAHLIRVFGNEFTHPKKEHETEITEMFNLMKILLTLMESRIKAINATTRLAEIKPLS